MVGIEESDGVLVEKDGLRRFSRFFASSHSKRIPLICTLYGLAIQQSSRFFSGVVLLCPLFSAQRSGSAARGSAYAAIGCSAKSIRKPAGNISVKDAGHKRLIGQAVFDGDGLELLQIL